MLINLRNALMTGKRLPYDAEVEYLESTGTQWIDTGVLVSSAKLAAGMRTELVASFASTNAAQAMLKNVIPYYFVGVNASGLFYSGLGSTYTASNTTNDTAVHKLILDSSTKQFSVDDVIATSYANTTGTSQSNILLFGTTTLTSAMGFMCLAKVYSCKIWDNGVLVRDFRPVRVGTDATSWEGAMMDVLTRRIYRNAGSGAFGYGNDLKYPTPAS